MKKSIAFYGIKYYPSKGGTSRVVENLIRQLASDFNITIYCYKNSLAKTHIKGVKAIEFPEIKWGNFGVFLFYLICCWHIRFKGNYDLIHAHKIDSFIFLRSLSKKTKVIATAHEAPYTRDKWGGLAKRFFRISEKRYLNFPGIKTAISKPLCDQYKAGFGVDVKYIPNGINSMEENDEVLAASFWPSELPINSSFVLFAARRIMGTKGLHTMLEAYQKNGYKGNIFIAGDLDNYPEYVKSIEKLCHGLKVFFLGFVHPLSALNNFVEQCDYFVFPSETEGMSIMLLEVARLGKPIIASDIPENTQILNKEEVLYFKNKNVDELAAKIKWAEENPSEFELFGQRAKAKVLSKYTWNRIAEDYKTLYQQVLN